jgi:hypothetical protein
MRHWIAAAPAMLLIACGGGGEAGGGNAAKAGGGGGKVEAASFQPGQWETIVQITRMEIPNMPQGAAPPTMPPTTVRSCLTEEQARQPSANFLTGSGENGGCTSENFTMAGGRISGTVQCNSQGTQVRSTMDGRYSPTTYELTMQSQTQAQGMNMEMDARITARRIGDCPAGG